MSRGPGSPVADVALRIGRAVGGVYNKVMNFRALDPRDDREGLPAGDAVDQEVWNEYYDANRRTLRSDDLERAFLDLWGDAHAAGVAQVQVQAQQGSPPPATSQPSRASMTTYRVIRDSAVTDWVKELHGHRCQACGQRFDSPRGPVAEGAHIRPLGAEHEGPDDVRNVLCLCPTHHALFDRGAFVVADDLSLHSTHVQGLLERLSTHARHEIGVEYLAYHRLTAGASHPRNADG